MAQSLPGDPRLPLSSLLPGVGQSVGVNLAHECQYGTKLPGTSIAATNSIESNQLGVDTIQHFHTVLSSTAFKGIHTASLPLIPAVSGKTTVVLGVMYTLNFGTTDYTSGGTVTLEYHTGPVAITSGIADSFFQGGSTAYTTDTVIPALAVQNNSIDIVSTGTFASGDSTVTVDISYVQW